MKSLLKFLCVVIAIIIVTALAIIIFDMTYYAHNPANTTANAIIISIRNFFPSNWIITYDDWRISFLSWLSDMLSVSEPL